MACELQGAIVWTDDCLLWIKPLVRNFIETENKDMFAQNASAYLCQHGII